MTCVTKIEYTEFVQFYMDMGNSRNEAEKIVNLSLLDECLTNF